MVTSPEFFALKESLQNAVPQFIERLQLEDNEIYEHQVEKFIAKIKLSNKVADRSSDLYSFCDMYSCKTIISKTTSKAQREKELTN